MKKNYFELTSTLVSLAVLKKWLLRCWSSLLLLIIMAVFMAPNSFGQTISDGPGGIGAFGVDGDVSANWQHRGPDQTLGVYDDWFLYPDTIGTGHGVLWDEGDASDLWTMAIILPLVDAREAFELRMKGDQGDTVVSNVTPYKWLDAVYGRDHVTAGGLQDQTVFTGTKDKNGDNPNTWNVGSGDVPQKNDIVDAMGYLRQDVKTDLDGHKHLWAFGAASTRSADGTSHVDFEFFREDVSYENGMYTSTGSDAGHTGWTFDGDGKPLTRGDLIVSVDLDKGGDNPTYSVRVWMEVALVEDYLNFNTLDSIPFELTGVYNQGLDAGIWCYAEIQPITGFHGQYGYLYAAVDSLEVPAAPWGTIEGSQADTAGNFIPYQFTEIGVNMTAFGLDALEAGGDPCKRILGTLFVKTRSSGEFTAELKDFAGPYRFGYSTSVILLAEDIETCVSPEATNVVNLNEVVVVVEEPTKAKPYMFYESEEDASLGSNPLPADTLDHYNFVGESVTLWVSAESKDAEGCFGVDSFTVTLYDNPVCTPTGNGTQADPIPYYSSTGWAEAVVTGGLEPYTYAWSNGENTARIENLPGSPGGITYYVTITDANNCQTTCQWTIFEQAAAPGCVLDATDLDCFGDSTGTAWLVSTEDLIGNPANWSYTWSAAEGGEIPAGQGSEDNLFGLKAGIYILSIVDSLGVQTQCLDTVKQPPYNPVVVECSDYTADACLTQGVIDAHFSNWLDTAFTVSGGTEPIDTTYKVDEVEVDISTLSAPDSCGGSITVEMVVIDFCGTADSCEATFSVNPAPLVTYGQPNNEDLAACTFTTQQGFQTAFDDWVSDQTLTFISVGGGCDPAITDNSDQITLDDFCTGDTVTVTWTITDNCITPVNLYADFMLAAPQDLLVSTPSDDYNSSCDYEDQAGVDTDFDLWMSGIQTALEDEVANQGCDPIVTDNFDDVYPMLCLGDTVMVTWTITDLCDTTTVSASFGVEAVQDLLVSTPSDDYNSSCDYEDQAGVDTDFDLWMSGIQTALEDEVANQGCDPIVTDNFDDVYPMLCLGDTVMVTWTITDLCDTTTVSASFGVEADLIAPVITIEPYADSLCNEAPGMIMATWTDNCGESGELYAEPVLVASPECMNVYEYTFTAIDKCENRTDTVITVIEYYDQVGGCETAFGRMESDYTGDEGALCFIDLEGNNGKPLFNRWGWTNRITTKDVEYVMNLYAGAAHCEIDGREPVGVVRVTWHGDSVHVVYEMAPMQYLSEIHVYVGEDQFPTLQKGKKPKPTVAPGQYTIKDEDLIVNNGADFWIHEVDYEDAFWIIAHGVVCELTCNCSSPEPQFGGLEIQEANAVAGRVKKSAEIISIEAPELVDGDFKVFPNPFDDKVQFEFVSAISGHAVLEIHNMLGQRIKRIIDQPVEAGELIRVEYKPESEISGIYLYRLDIDGQMRIGKLIYRNK